MRGEDAVDGADVEGKVERISSNGRNPRYPRAQEPESSFTLIERTTVAWKDRRVRAWTTADLEIDGGWRVFAWCSFGIHRDRANFRTWMQGTFCQCGHTKPRDVWKARTSLQYKRRTPRAPPNSQCWIPTAHRKVSSVPSDHENIRPVVSKPRFADLACPRDDPIMNLRPLVSADAVESVLSISRSAPFAV